MWTADSLEKSLMLGKIEGRRWGGWQRIIWLDVITNLMEMSFSKLQERWWIGKPGVQQSLGSQSQTHWATKLNRHTFERTHLNFINYIQEQSSLSPREASISTINIYSYPHTFWRVPWTLRKSNKSILKEISPEYSLEGLMLKLKLQ